MNASYPDLDTPALLVDLAVLRSNIQEMSDVARAGGVRLRPHTKTHKCPEIARMQVDAGAAGITVAKLGEAEVMVGGGLDDVLVAYPVVGEAKLGRLRSLMERTTVRVGLDSTEVAEGVGRVGRDVGRPVPVLVEVDTGLHRLGRAPGADSAALAARIAAVPGVEVVGLMTHAGHAYRCTTAAGLEDVVEREVAGLLDTAERLSKAGIEIAEVSVGSTPTARIEARQPGVTEIRPGTYVFNDVQQLRLGSATESTCAARVLVTVVSAPGDGRFVVDAGTKAFTSDGDGGPPLPGRGVVSGRPDLRIDFMNEEHAVGHLEPGDDAGASPAVGDRLQVIPLHVCACVNMFDVAYGVCDGRVDRELAVAGRGRMR